MKYLTSNIKETKEIGNKEARKIKKKKTALVFCLRGDLGAGKTAFLQGFGKGLGVKEKIQSPTFVIMSRFPLKKTEFNNFFHFDCYRLENPEEIINLGFKDIIINPENIVAIEWPEKIEKFLPKKRTEIIFKTINEDEREIIIKNIQ
ncbi:MAG: tRNA (adenosine(37)-N6)-threonylcarbamoyltransferase complex ATPase subunit type 1 TsaE [Candidatus Paceibacterota bacterium]